MRRLAIAGVAGDDGWFLSFILRRLLFQRTEADMNSPIAGIGRAAAVKA
jgi:hypothetical protein